MGWKVNKKKGGICEETQTLGIKLDYPNFSGNFRYFPYNFIVWGLKIIIVIVINNFDLYFCFKYKKKFHGLFFKMKQAILFIYLIIIIWTFKFNYHSHYLLIYCFLLLFSNKSVFFFHLIEDVIAKDEVVDDSERYNISLVNTLGETLF